MRKDKHGEHRSFPADKFIPKEYMMQYKGEEVRKTLKKMHKRRSRQYNKWRLLNGNF